ncbi:TPA: transposase [Legionella pneumophila]|nr:transposase [Legionella pneumophila]HAT2135410.1 transposase [Legionella pneumophila]HAT2141529.1 transposase [Legionella pneumophila]HAT2144784.1 transposase [Legionella pneumophila]HAT2159888.1 transposase [Legionella pneumophila]
MISLFEKNSDELQEDVDNWLQSYNELRPHSGRFCYGKTPMQTFNDAAHLAKSKVLHNALEPHHISNNPREDELPLLESSLAERGTAPWSETNKEHNFSMARIKELE